MRSQLVVPPATEPVSVAQAKLYLRIDGADEDDLIASLIRAARLLVEAAAGRQLIAQTWRITLDAIPAGAVIRAPVSPVRTAGRVATVDSLGATQVLAAGAVELEAGSDPPLLRWRAAIPVAARAIEIDVDAGYGSAATDVPDSLRTAILRLVALWFDQRGDRLDGQAAALPPDVMALVAPHRRARL